MEDQPAYGVRLHELPGYQEKLQCRLPALHLLMQLGWNYLTPEEADRLRGGRMGGTILEPVLADHIRRHCLFTFKGATHPFTENAIQSAVQALKAFRAPGTAYRSEQAYDLLCLGTSVPQVIESDTKSFTIDYIDWKNPSNNTFHCTADFKVERAGIQQHAVADIVLFVNGIPLVVMACSHPTHTRTRKAPIDWVIDKLGGYQAKDGIPQLFLYCQVLLAVTRDKARYGTTGTPPHLWSVWKEAGLAGALRRIMNTPLEAAASAKLLSQPFSDVRDAYESLMLHARKITEQDRSLYALCRPERLLELAYKFMLFDGGIKKIARYHQYFTIKEILKRVLSGDEGRARPGGVVWHTQGSGKSLTMVMLAKSLALHPSILNPKIVLVTDRIDLDDQICGTFRACGLTPEQATTGKQLVSLLQDRRTHVVTTLIQKFAAAAANRNLRQTDRNTFVLVDEGHRSQYNAQHARMRVALKRACFIAFTGTPLARKAKKNTFDRFGDLIRPAYTITRAVEDKAVVPLLYEARHVPQTVDPAAVDDWFEKLTTGLTDDQKADLKRSFSTKRRLNKAAEKVRMIAGDLSMHYSATFQNTGFKGQLVAPDKEAALRYKAFLDGLGLVTSEVLISAPATREGEERRSSPTEVENKFWQSLMDRFGSEKNYNRQVINAFKFNDHPEIIIVVDKLLTGFNAPRNAVLYLARRLTGHTLLQAVARVNRLHPGKEYGLILDYSDVTRDLDDAMDFYGRLAGYDPADLESTVASVRERTDRLPQMHANVRDLFDAVKGDENPEAYEICLRNDLRRNRFYERFSLFARTMALALSSTAYLVETPPKTVRRFKADLAFFQNLRAAVGQRYQESLDYSPYEPLIKKLIDTHVGAAGVRRLSEPINLLDIGKRNRVLKDESKSTGARADMIAAATRHVIELEMSRDPAFYQKFSMLLEEVIAAHRAGRLLALDALEKVKDIAVKVATHTDDDIPRELIGNEMARRYYGCVCESMPAYGTLGAKPAARIAKLISERLGKHKIRDWRKNPDAINKMRGEIDDILFDAVEELGIDLSLEDQDAIIDRCIEVAVANED